MARRRVALRVGLLLAALVAAAPASGGVDGWLTYGSGLARTSFTAEPAGPFARSWFLPLYGRATGQPLVARGVPGPGTSTVVVATTAGRVYGLTPNGYVRWQRDLGQLDRPCPDLEGWGVTGTPANDPDTGALYVADPFGRLHALDLASGADLPGWPVRLYPDYLQEHVFGALAVVKGAVYVPTASYCDSPMEGKLIRVATDTGEVSSWVAVPFRLGGGGGIWGFGGAAYSAFRDSLLAATGNAFKGGANAGPSYSESAGYGEQLVELSPDLELRAASHPPGITQKLDLDFGSSPVVADRPPCPELAAALNKDGVLYAWRTDAIAAGPVWAFRVRRTSLSAPTITQPAWSPAQASFYLATATRLLQIAMGGDCRPHLGWTLPLRPSYIQGAPTVAGSTVWLSTSGKVHGLLAVAAASGRILARIPLDADAFAAPVAVDGRLYLASFAGGLHGFLPIGTPVGRTTSALAGHRSFLDARHGWESRENGVYATDDAGRIWRKIFPFAAARVVRTGARSGLVATGLPAPACHCRLRVLWTTNAGQHWHDAGPLGPLLAGRGNLLYASDGRTLRRVQWPPSRRTRTLSSRPVARVDRAAIVDLASIPGGIVALVTSRLHGHGWDSPPHLLLRSVSATRTIALPQAGANVLAESLIVAWPTITVSGTDYAPAAEAAVPVTWTSRDGGATWAVARGGS